MLSLWSAKGGVGTTVTCALAAVQQSAIRPTVLVDLAGDLPDVIGRPHPSRGVRTAILEPSTDLAGLAVELTASLTLVGAGEWSGDDPDPDPGVSAALIDELAAWEDRSIVVDLGTGPPPWMRVIAGAGSSVVVVQPCYVALRRTLAALRDLPAVGVVVVARTGALLDQRDVEAVLGIPVLASVPVDPRLAAAVDAGTLLSGRLRMPSLVDLPW